MSIGEEFDVALISNGEEDDASNGEDAVVFISNGDEDVAFISNNGDEISIAGEMEDDVAFIISMTGEEEE